MKEVPGEVWLVWGNSCYYDHGVEAVSLSKNAALSHVLNLRDGSSKPRLAYDHPSAVEYAVEHFRQLLKEEG